MSKGNFLTRPINLWRRYIIDQLTKDDSVEHVTRDYNIYSNGDALMSGADMITFIYTIDKYAAEIPTSFRKILRSESIGGVKVSFITVMEPESIDWNSPRIKARTMAWKSSIEDREEVTEFNFVKEMTELSGDDLKRASLVYLPTAQIKRGRSLFNVKQLVLVQGKRGNDFDKVNKQIVESARKVGIQINRVTEHIDDFLASYSPFNFRFDNDINKEVGRIVLPDELISRFNVYTQGKIGSTGTYWGTDIYSGFPVFKKTKRDATDAENWLITAVTGGGKSFAAKNLLLQLAGDPQYRMTINDIEGFEYIYLASFVAGAGYDVVLLDMSEGMGRYFDPMEIVMTGNNYIDDGSFSMSKAFATNIFSVLLGDVYKNSWAPDIISDAISRTYIEAGVKEEDMSTWELSSGLTLHSVYDNIKKSYLELRNKELAEEVDGLDAFKRNNDYISAYDQVISKLIKYFEAYEDGGTESSLFKERVYLNEVRNAKIVINSFGMAGKDMSAMSGVSMSLAQIYSSFITQIRSLFASASNQYNVKVYEEFQRWGKFEGSIQTIGQSLTGGRKMGDVNVVITNDLAELIRDDRFNIFQNITSFMIGKISDSTVRNDICNILDMPEMASELSTIDKYTGDNKTFSEGTGGVNSFRSAYDKAFLVRLDGSITTTVRVSLPAEISGSKIFRTANNIAEMDGFGGN